METTYNDSSFVLGDLTTVSGFQNTEQGNERMDEGNISIYSVKSFRKFPLVLMKKEPIHFKNPTCKKIFEQMLKKQTNKKTVK